MWTKNTAYVCKGLMRDLRVWRQRLRWWLVVYWHMTPCRFADTRSKLQCVISTHVKLPFNELFVRLDLFHLLPPSGVEEIPQSLPLLSVLSTSSHVTSFFLVTSCNPSFHVFLRRPLGLFPISLASYTLFSYSFVNCLYILSHYLSEEAAGSHTNYPFV